eukprot:TRINITY_DN16_c1_g2_i1.p1 TRINITY_DN16_c1_g2~~TRINITY_DN16_c1_g2_i1.p1  ORF type:complete len:236 (+),score=77.56 TRINITY_DN16_c1_g2_i1:270-977(+)
MFSTLAGTVARRLGAVKQCKHIVTRTASMTTRVHTSLRTPITTTTTTTTSAPVWARGFSTSFHEAPLPANNQSPTGKQYDELKEGIEDDEWQRKETTGLVGLEVVPNARHVLAEQYKVILEMLKTIPPKAYYRQSVEKYIRYRLGVVVSNKNIRDIEEIINCGEIEELIEQAKDEIHLIPLMAEWKPWEAPEIDESVRDREEAMYPEEKEERLAWEAEMEELRRIEEEKAANEKK